MTAFNKHGQGASTVYTYIVNFTPNDLQEFRAVQVDRDSITLEWSRGNHDNATCNFEIRIYDDVNAKWLDIGDVNTYSFGGLLTDVFYTF